MSRDYQPVTISDDLWLAVFFFNSTNTLLREGLNSIYSRAPQFRTPGASALHTLRNIYYSFSFRKGSTRHDLRIRPARRLKLRALHSHPHFAFLVFSPRSPYPVARLWGHASPTLRLGARAYFLSIIVFLSISPFMSISMFYVFRCSYIEFW